VREAPLLLEDKGMTTTQRDFIIPAGSILEFIVDVVGGPDSLVGYAGAMQIRALRTDLTVLAEVPTEAITVDDANRQVTVRIPSSETVGYTWRQGVYDLVITKAADSWRLVEGRIFNSLPVTRED
jgi:hypothetical protein